MQKNSGGRPVTSIGQEAFREAGLRQIILPEGLRRIGENAFCACSFREPLVLPDSVEEIGAIAFYRLGGTFPDWRRTRGRQAKRLRRPQTSIPTWCAGCECSVTFL